MRIRSLAWLAIAAQAVFIASWVIAGALEPGYSPARSTISALEADGASHPWIVMTGLFALALGAAALVPGLRATLPDRPATRVAAALFGVVALGFLVVVLVRPDCDIAQHACHARWKAGQLTWRIDAHGWAAFVTMLALLGTPFALARALWPSPAGGLALGAGDVGIVIAVAGLAAGRPDGTGERIQFVIAQLWLVIVAVGILHETRGEPRFSAPAPLRPRDFFGSEWSGEGQVRPWPYWLWSVAGPSFTFTRTTTWPSEDIGLVHDRAVLRSGRVEERLRYARLLDATRIHVTSDDMPDGAEIRIDEDGFRIAPFRVAVPVGPLRLIVTCHSETRVWPDGTFAYGIKVRWHGLPVARVDMRSRPVDTASVPRSQAAAGRPG